jgi:hypothetical protein
MLTQHSAHAVKRITQLTDDPNPKVRFDASKFVIDKVIPDKVVHDHNVDGGLTIRYVEDSEDKVPTIDVTPSKDIL